MIYAKEKPNIAKSIIGTHKWDEINKKTGGLGHKYYEESRVLNKKDKDYELKLGVIENKSRAYYSKFYYSYPKAWP
ncbi:MAG: hypothetical protein WAZ98_03235 [Cyclobacteriaceae bacterium]